MMRSMFAGVSGLRTHQVRMDVIGNNIANVNTAGFKGSRVTFQEALSQTLNGASMPSDTRGGVNPRQVGMGTRLGSVDVLHNQGNIESTDYLTDLAIEGNGFFILSEGEQQYYTRAGMFDFDGDGNLISKANGMRVMGYTADKDGNIKVTPDRYEPLQVSVNEKLDPIATNRIRFGGNLSAAPDATPYEIAGAASLDFPYEVETGSRKEFGIKVDNDAVQEIVLIEGQYNRQQLVNEINSQLSGATVSVDSSNRLTITHNTEGPESTLQLSGDYEDLFIATEESVLGSTEAHASLQINWADINGETSVTFDGRSIAVGATFSDFLTNFNTEFGGSWTASDLDPVGAPETTILITADESGSEYNDIELDYNVGTVATADGAYDVESTLTSAAAITKQFIEDLGDLQANPKSFDVTFGNPATTSTITLDQSYYDPQDMVDNIQSQLLDGSGDPVLNVSLNGDSQLVFTAVNAGADPIEIDLATSPDWGTFARVDSTETNGDYDLIPLSTHVYDSLGGSHTVVTEFQKAGDNLWTWRAYLDSDPGTELNRGQLEFDTNGRLLNSEETGYIEIDASKLDPRLASNIEIDLDFGSFTQYVESSTATVRGQNGFPSGSLDSLEVTANGIIVGSFSNGLNKSLGQIALARFENPAGLSKAGSTMFAETINSGDKAVGISGQDGLGDISPSSLEMSNVDLSQEFTNMIITQRGFQANSRIITSSDEMLQELVNLKR